jgi:tRNA G18 (ribose-2'-O)-methylase SpoU
LATPISITRENDPRLDPFRDIRERDRLGRDGTILIEGETALAHALGSDRIPVEAALFSERRLNGSAALAARLAGHCPLLTASDEIISAIAGFPLHRGILAVAKYPDLPTVEGLLASLGPSALVIVVSGIANHDNMGGIFRNAAAFGADAVILDEACCDPLYRKAIRVSVGASLLVSFAKGGAAEPLLEQLASNGFSILSLSPKGISNLASIRRAPKQAVVLGAEGPGLPHAVLDRYPTCRIDMAKQIDSLNVAVTSGIILARLFEQCENA